MSTYKDITAIKWRLNIMKHIVTWNLSHHLMLNYIAPWHTTPWSYHQVFQILSGCPIIHNTCTYGRMMYNWYVHRTWIYNMYVYTCCLYILPGSRCGVQFLYHFSSLIYHICPHAYLSIAYFVFHVSYFNPLHQITLYYINLYHVVY